MPAIDTVFPQVLDAGCPQSAIHIVGSNFDPIYEDYHCVFEEGQWESPMHAETESLATCSVRALFAHCYEAKQLPEDPRYLLD